MATPATPRPTRHCSRKSKEVTLIYRMTSRSAALSTACGLLLLLCTPQAFAACSVAEL